MRGLLKRHAPEDVVLLMKSVETFGPLEEAREVFVEGDTVHAMVEPLGAELAVALGLIGTAERLRVQLPPLQVGADARLRCRGRDWRVINVSQWQSYTVAIVEGVA